MNSPGSSLPPTAESPSREGGEQPGRSVAPDQLVEETVIEAGRTGRRYLRDLWHYRELFMFLAWRDLLIRYKQTVVGVLWALLRPLLTMLVLTFVFGRLSKLPSDGVPYPLLVLSGLIPWAFFSSAISDSGNSLVASSGLITKVYFPRLVIPLGSLLTTIVDLAISVAFLGVLMAVYGFVPPLHVVFLPFFLLLAAATSFGFGIWVAASMVKYRDFRFIVPFAVQFGLYISPVGYSSSVVPAELRPLYALNPMAGVIDGVRWCVLGGSHALYLPGLVAATTISVLLLVSGVWFFRVTERSFADVI